MSDDLTSLVRSTDKAIGYLVNTPTTEAAHMQLVFFQNPVLWIFLGLFVVLFAFLGRTGSRGSATSTPLTFLLFLGLLMIVIGILGYLP